MNDNEKALGHHLEATEPLMLTLHHGNCFDVLPSIPSKSVQLVIADLPYGVTACPWDRKIDLVRFWTEMRRIVTPTGAVVMFATQPFASELVMSNREWFRYSLIWRKHRPTGFQRCWQRVLSAHEDILIFSPGTAAPGKQNAPRQMTYNPQGLVRLLVPRKRKPAQRIGFLGKQVYKGGFQKWTNFPRSVLEFDSPHKPAHPTQKPIDLLGYLIRTFSNAGDVVLDPTMGAGSTGVAALAETRKFIGIELDAHFYEVAVQRVDEVEGVPFAQAA
jgi:DNA modification methylase